MILPSKDAVGAHGKTYLFIGFDEIHGYRNWDIFEAVASVAGIATPASVEETVVWSNWVSVVPPTMVALAALIDAWKAVQEAKSGRITSEQIEEKVNGKMQDIVSSLETNVRLVAESGAWKNR